MMNYNGYKNYETWNVSLWIKNDESLFNLAKCSKNYSQFQNTMLAYGYEKTPDGVDYHASELDLEALEEVINETK
jgi:hypothetical protein